MDKDAWIGLGLLLLSVAIVCASFIIPNRRCIAHGYEDAIEWRGHTLCIGYTADGTIHFAPLAELEGK